MNNQAARTETLITPGTNPRVKRGWPKRIIGSRNQSAINQITNRYSPWNAWKRTRSSVRKRWLAMTKMAGAQPTQGM